MTFVLHITVRGTQRVGRVAMQKTKFAIRVKIGAISLLYVVQSIFLKDDSCKTVHNLRVYSVHDFASNCVEGRNVYLLIDSGSQLTIFPYDWSQFSSFSLSKSDVHVTQFESPGPTPGRFEALLATGKNSIKTKI